MNIFTNVEKTVKRHNVNFIVKQARDVLNSKNIAGLCTNQLPLDYGQLYTTEEASKIIDKVVGDSLFYA
jgi:predicted xylose isomerase-like sugar epimerase